MSLGDPSAEPVTRPSPHPGRLRGLLILGCLALVWWAVWLFDPRNQPGTIFFAIVAGTQLVDLLAVLGFWHAIWPPTRAQAPVAPLPRRAPLGAVRPLARPCLHRRRGPWPTGRDGRADPRGRAVGARPAPRLPRGSLPATRPPLAGRLARRQTAEPWIRRAQRADRFPLLCHL